MRLGLFFISLFIFSSLYVPILVPSYYYVSYGNDVFDTHFNALVESVLRYPKEELDYADRNDWHAAYYFLANFLVLGVSVLNLSSVIDLDYYLWYISSFQYVNWSNPFFNGGWPFMASSNGSAWGYDLATSYWCLLALKRFDALNLINVEALKNFVLVRYNWSSGAFHEIRYELPSGQLVAMESAPVFFHYLFPDTFAYDNVFSTYYAVSILYELDALNLIDANLTANYILSLINPYGLFYPVRNYSIYHPLHPVFPLDTYGTYGTYVYAAYMTLFKLGKVDLLPSDVLEMIYKYVKKSFVVVDSKGLFYRYAEPWVNYWFRLEFDYSNFYMVDLLDHMGMLDNFFEDERLKQFIRGIKYDLNQEHYKNNIDMFTYLYLFPVVDKLDLWWVLSDKTPSAKALENKIRAEAFKTSLTIIVALAIIYVITYDIIIKVQKGEVSKEKAVIFAALAIVGIAQIAIIIIT